MARFEKVTSEGFRITAVSAPYERNDLLCIRAYTYIFSDDVHVATIAADKEDASFHQSVFWADDVPDAVRHAVCRVCECESGDASVMLLLWLVSGKSCSLRNLFEMTRAMIYPPKYNNCELRV
jgi:hypothetical protein